MFKCNRVHFSFLARNLNKYSFLRRCFHINIKQILEFQFMLSNNVSIVIEVSLKRHQIWESHDTRCSAITAYRSLGISKFRCVARMTARMAANKPTPLTCPGQSQPFISLPVGTMDVLYNLDTVSLVGPCSDQRLFFCFAAASCDL